jgi:hypothetical protein
MASIPNVLRPFTNVEHELESFPWHMAGQLVKQLENPEANFEYLHLTKYCVARAALLAIKGDVLDRADLHTALCKHQVQFGGIYRKHLIRVFRNFLEKHNIANLPECDIYMIDPLHGSGQVAKNRDLLQCLIHTAEFDYTNTLIFLSLAPEADEKIFDQTAGYWGRGGEMPKASSVPVLGNPRDRQPIPNQLVARNRERFPDDFCFQLTETEWHSLRLQNATLKQGQHRKYLPLGFTEHGAIMEVTKCDLHLMAMGSNGRAEKREVIAICDRFPASFAFQLTAEEWNRLRSQIVTSKGRGGRRQGARTGVRIHESVFRSQNKYQTNGGVKIFLLDSEF